MSSASPIILILGAGANIGQHVAKAFAAKSYRVVLSSRNAPAAKFTPDQVHIPSDLSDPKAVTLVFSKVKELLGGVPSVVIYNAAATTFNGADNPFSISVEEFTRDLTINTTSAFVAAQQAALAFSQLPDDAAKTFIYTGNILNITTMAPLLTLGVGKSATAHMIQSAAAAYGSRGLKFYYADERKADGSAAFMDLDGAAAGAFYLDLAAGKEQGPWQQTFVKDVGYKHFPVA